MFHAHTSRIFLPRCEGVLSLHLAGTDGELSACVSSLATMNPAPSCLPSLYSYSVVGTCVLTSPIPVQLQCCGNMCSHVSHPCTATVLREHVFSCLPSLYSYSVAGTCVLTSPIPVQLQCCGNMCSHVSHPCTATVLREHVFSCLPSLYSYSVAGTCVLTSPIPAQLQCCGNMCS